MEWITSIELIAILKRFPYTKIVAKHHLGARLGSQHVWEFHSDKGIFYQHKTRRELTEKEFLNLYAADNWRPEPFFFLNDEKQKILAVRIVEHLIMTGNLDWIISECNIEFVRECQHCHKLINEGWLCGDIYTFCSDECLLRENPDMTAEKLEELACDDYSDVHWIEWYD